MTHTCVHTPHARVPRSCACSFLMLAVLKRVVPGGLRVSREEELKGLDFVEHGRRSPSVLGTLPLNRTVTRTSSKPAACGSGGESGGGGQCQDVALPAVVEMKEVKA